jgi:hypothetical protein
MAVEILDALRYLHERRPPIIHRDINPRNLICRPDGRWSLIDFGAIQRMLRDPVVGGSTIVGTFGYMAPGATAGASRSRLGSLRSGDLAAVRHDGPVTCGRAAAPPALRSAHVPRCTARARALARADAGAGACAALARGRAGEGGVHVERDLAVTEDTDIGPGAGDAITRIGRNAAPVAMFAVVSVVAVDLSPRWAERRRAPRAMSPAPDRAPARHRARCARRGGAASSDA